MLSVKKISESTGHRSPIYGLCTYKPGSFLTGGGEGWIAEWKLASPENARLFATVPTSIFSLYYLVEKDIVIAGDRDGGLHWIDSEKKSNDVFAHKNGVYGIYKIANNICTIGGDGYLTFWDIASQKAVESIQFSTSALRSLALDHLENELYLGSSDGFLHKYNLNKSQIEYSLKIHEGAVFSLEVPDDGEIISGGKDALLKVHYNNPPELIETINAHWFAIYAIRMNPWDTVFATASRDKTIRLWESLNYSPITTIDYASHQGHVRSVNNLLWMEDGKHLISVSDDTKMIIWEIDILN